MTKFLKNRRGGEIGWDASGITVQQLFSPCTWENSNSKQGLPGSAKCAGSPCVLRFSQYTILLLYQINSSINRIIRKNNLHPCLYLALPFVFTVLAFDQADAYFLPFTVW